MNAIRGVRFFAADKNGIIGDTFGQFLVGNAGKCEPHTWKVAAAACSGNDAIALVV